MRWKSDLYRSAPMLALLGVFLAEYLLVLAGRSATGAWAFVALALPVTAALVVHWALRRFEWYRPS